jgi:Smg protein
MFDILMFLFESYYDAGNYPEHDTLTVKLSAAGFDDGDIHLALTWLSGLKQLSADHYPPGINREVVRIYADLEMKRISSEALSFITFWEQNKVITPVEREMILDRAVALERENLSLDRVKLIALIVLWNLRNELDPLLVEDMLSPSGDGLH